MWPFGDVDSSLDGKQRDSTMEHCIAALVPRDSSCRRAGDMIGWDAVGCLGWRRPFNSCMQAALPGILR